MQFLVFGYDGADKEAAARRQAVRQAHIEYGDTLRNDGKMLYGVALLDDDDQMAGSVVVYDVESREELDSILADEPYVTGEVWMRTEVIPCRVGPSFANMKLID